MFSLLKYPQKSHGYAVCHLAALYYIATMPLKYTKVSSISHPCPPAQGMPDGPEASGFHTSKLPSLSQTAIQYRTEQSVKVFISLFPYISPLLHITDGAKLILLGTCVSCGLNPSVHCFAYFACFPLLRLLLLLPLLWLMCVPNSSDLG